MTVSADASKNAMDESAARHATAVLGHCRT